MNRQAAVEYLKERYPDVVELPDGCPVDLERLHLEYFWLQGHACNLMDSRDRDVADIFSAVRRTLLVGDREVRSAVVGDFLYPHLSFHDDIDWAIGLMPEELAAACAKIRAVRT